MTQGPIVRQFAAAVLDVNNLHLEARFWGRILGEVPGPVRSDGGWITVGQLSSGASLVLQKVPESKVVKNRVHLDFIVDDVTLAISRIVELGGRPIGEPRPGGGVTMADPEGNEFCIGAFVRSKDGIRTPL